MKKPKAITIRLTADEHEQIMLAASLTRFTAREYIVRAINAQLRREGVDAVLLAESGRWGGTPETPAMSEREAEKILLGGTMSTEQEKPAGAQGETPKIDRYELDTDTAQDTLGHYIGAGSRVCFSGDVDDLEAAFARQSEEIARLRAERDSERTARNRAGNMYEREYARAEAAESQVQALQAQLSEAQQTRSVMVTQPNEEPVPAPCCIEGCHYDRYVEAQQWAEVVTRGKSPCGHWSAYARTNDGGKRITCLQCELTEAQQRIETLTKLAREVLVWLPDNLPSSELYAAVDNLAAVVPPAPPEDQP